MERDRVAIYMLNTQGGARQTPKITTAQISIVASVVNLIMVTLAHILRICNVDNLEDNKTKMIRIFIFKVSTLRNLKVPQDLTYASMSTYLQRNSEMKFHGALDVMTNPVHSV